MYATGAEAHNRDLLAKPTQDYAAHKLRDEKEMGVNDTEIKVLDPAMVVICGYRVDFQGHLSPLR